MSKLSKSNKTIAKNTMFLYVRMLLVMGISLYTSRLILKYLGVEDFGIYNIVGSVVVLFSFLNNAMTSTSQRFINFEIGKSEGDVNAVFCTIINIHFIISAAILILGETVGLWLLNSYLNIPPQRMYAANLVFQISLFTSVVSVLRIPYNAMIIAHEKMSFYAMLGIVEVVGKLLIVLSLSLVVLDKLIVYAILLGGLSVAINSFYYIYCKKMYRNEIKFRFQYDAKLFREMANFSGWSIFGNVALIGSNQGVNVLLNTFFGVVVNATMGIANQVNTAIYSFVTGFQTAFMPQITQSYAESNLSKHRTLVLQASRFSFYILLIVSVPILLCTTYILDLWLEKYPPYTVTFVEIIIFISLIDALSGPLWMSANAIGKMRKYQLGVAFLLMMNIPIAYIFLSNGLSPVSVMLLKLLLQFCTYIFRLSYVYSKVQFDWKTVLNYFSRLAVVGLLVISPIYLIDHLLDLEEASSIKELMIYCASSLIYTFLIIWTIGINKEERTIVTNMIQKNIFKNRNA